MENENNETLRVQLNFPLDQVPKPVIWHLSHDFGVVFSIRRAQIDAHAGGFCVLELTGPRESIDAGLKWVENEGVGVSTVGAAGPDEWAAH